MLNVTHLSGEKAWSEQIEKKVLVRRSGDARLLIL